jgi:hypothetical protein
MRVNGKPVSELIADDITALLGQSESQVIDFKMVGYEGGSWAAELAKDVIGMANASGGVILIGIDEQNEQVVGWPGIALENGGKDPMEKYQRSLRDRVEPPVYGIIIRSIDIGNGRHVVAIGIPASFGRPHRVKITGDGSGRGRWAIRRERDTLDMTYDEIRASFLGAAQADSKVREFHRERAALLQRTWSTVQGYGGVMVLHVVPIGFPKGQLDVQRALMLRDFFQPPGENPGFVGLFADFDGVIGRVTIGQEGESTGWVKVYRNGIVEGVKGHYTALDGMPGDQGRRYVFNHYRFERSVLAAVSAYIDGLMKLGFDPPFAISLTLLNGPPATIDQIGGHRRPIEHTTATLEPGLIENIVSGSQYDTELHPMFDQLWNAFGMPRALSFDNNGVWRGIPGPVNMQQYG